MSSRAAAGISAILVLLLIGAAPAGAAPPKSAQRFVAAVERGERSLQGVYAEIGRRSRAFEREVPRCERAIEGAFSDEVDKRLEIRAGAIVWSALVRPWVELTLPVFRQVVADLDAVATRDPALRAGRNAWRRGVRVFSSFRAPLERPCEALEQWRAAGFTAASAPITHTEALRFWRLLAQTDDERDRRYARAVKRLRALGISRRRANAFNGHRHFDIFSDDH